MAPPRRLSIVLWPPMSGLQFSCCDSQPKSDVSDAVNIDKETEASDTDSNISNCVSETYPFGKKTAKTVKELFWETCQRKCKLQWVDGRLQRHVQVMKIYLHAMTPWGPKVLIRKSEKAGGRKRDLSKLHRPVSKQIFFDFDDDEDSFQVTTLHNRCGLPEKVQQKYLEFMYRTEYQEGPMPSFGYPTLMTHYVVIERHLRITDVYGDGLQAIGLPSGSDFSHIEDGLPFTRKHHWNWCRDPSAASSRRGLCGLFGARAKNSNMTSISESIEPSPVRCSDAHEESMKRSSSILSCCLRA
eukprot:GEMP01035102.1.p1 GENE.GEMP01035102.1~~GEMP01035102.1.p1  ORF type:complete len:299 (+),score=43.28 GEMP01035102.1:129-1025(+)